MKYQLLLCEEAIAIASLKNDVLREVGALARCIWSIHDIVFRGLGLQRGQFVFLTRVCEHPGVNLAELSALLKVDKTTTTKAVQKLLAEGYVERRRDDVDGRMWRLVPTARALGLYPRLIAEENRCLDICLAGFVGGERAAAESLLRRMRGNIEQEWQAMKTGRGEEDVRDHR